MAFIEVCDPLNVKTFIYKKMSNETKSQHRENILKFICFFNEFNLNFRRILASPAKNKISQKTGTLS